MKCFYHYEKDSQAVCSLCSHPLCEDCIINVQEKIYCRECIQKAQREALPQEASHQVAPQPVQKSPALATFFSIIPGLGFIYLGQYIKGIAIFAAWIVIVNIFGHTHHYALLSIGFWIFQLIYTNQEAKRLNRAKAGEAEAEKMPSQEGSIAWGIAIIVIGILFLINNLGFDLSWLAKFWPLIVIGLGAQLIWNSRKAG